MDSNMPLAISVRSNQLSYSTKEKRVREIELAKTALEACFYQQIHHMESRTDSNHDSCVTGRHSKTAELQTIFLLSILKSKALRGQD